MLKSTKAIHSLQNPFRPSSELPFLQFPGLSRVKGLRHAVYTRHGGFSLPPYESLNISSVVGDKAHRVAENLHTIQQSFGAPYVQEMNQVHGDHILVLAHEQGINSDTGALPADALVTNVPGVALMVKQADCQAVIIVDPVKKVAAIVHCGWRGNTANLPGKVIDSMKFSFACSPAEMRAAIGPSLGPCCAEFTSYKTLFPSHFNRFMVRRNYFDLWEVSRRQLLEAGLQNDKIEVAGICTRCRTDVFFSYRAEGTTGRFATLVMLEP
ncbi:MAG: peptidoglycan editing factor PgeF [Deltaproteobacteria bacterium]|nr:peptidoglycan editing factor PgeF [Deltaproteobacteria bacterium]